ncbi:hypothetical protein AB0M05_44080 [Streptomyces violaceusniger]|uniref:hypothetical protein n=1 Tax=Streptomyces violaceusniger TaxID=68280 RepID=UPI00341D48ED
MKTEITGDDWLALLSEGFAVELLGNELTVQTVKGGVVDARLQRSYLVRRAAFADRAATALRDVTSELDAEDAARRLLDHDRAHGTDRGAVPAAERRWDIDPCAYAHQEHAVAVRDEYDQREQHDQHDQPDAGI